MVTLLKMNLIGLVISVNLLFIYFNIFINDNGINLFMLFLIVKFYRQIPEPYDEHLFGILTCNYKSLFCFSYTSLFYLLSRPRVLFWETLIIYLALSHSYYITYHMILEGNLKHIPKYIAYFRRLCSRSPQR